MIESITVMAAKYEVEKFDGLTSSSSLWGVKMKAWLTQQGLHKALLGKEKKPENFGGNRLGRSRC